MQPAREPAEPTSIERLLVASKLRDARRRAGLDQTALADLVDVSQTTISNWELAKSGPTIAEWIRIAAATRNDDLLDLRSFALPGTVTRRELQLALPLDCLVLPGRSAFDTAIAV